MRTKSKYRFKDGGRVAGQDELPIEQPVEQVSAPPETSPAPPVDEPPGASQPEPPQDDATAALRAQIDGLRRSEAFQQQQQQQMHDASMRPKVGAIHGWNRHRERNKTSRRSVIFIMPPSMAG